MIRLRLFGAIELRDGDGAELHSVLSQPKRTAVLAYLATTSGGYCRRDRLLGLLWPELDEGRARNALSKALHHLRRSLGEGAIMGRGDDELKLNGEVLWSDVAAFVAAISKGDDGEAIALYRGHFLEGFHLPDAPEYQRWLDDERTRLLRAATEAAGRLAEASPDPQEAVRWARRSHALSPDEEMPLRRLLSLLGRAGERAEAVTIYNGFAERLRAEYDLEPAAETQALIADLQTQVVAGVPDPAVRPGPSAPEQVEIPTAPSAVASGTAAAPSSGPARVGGRGWRSARPAARGAVTAGLLGAAAVVAFASFQRDASPPWHEETVLVASFENRTGDPGLDVLGDMAADWITQGLQQTGQVRVIDPASALLANRAAAAEPGAAGDHARIVSLARESGAGAVITGAIYAQGDSLVLRARIVDARERRVIQALEPVVTEATDPVGGVDRLRNQVAGAIAAMRDRRIASISAVTSRPPNFEAYQAYIRGMELYLKSDVRGAVPYFEAAMRADSTFYQAHFWALFAYWPGNHVSDWRQKRVALLEALTPARSRMTPIDQHALDYFIAQENRDYPAVYDAAKAAARLAPGSHWSWNAGLQAFQDRLLSEAVAWFQQIRPEHGWAQGWPPYWGTYTFTLHVLGDHERELEMARRGRRIDPHSRPLALYEIRALIALGRIQEALAVVEELPRLHDHSALANPIGGFLEVASELIAHGHDDAGASVARAAVERARMPGVGGPHCDSLCGIYLRQSLGFALYFAGEWDEADGVLTALIEDYPQNSVPSKLKVGVIAARRGDHERALTMLEELMGYRDVRKPTWEAAITGWLGDHERMARALSGLHYGRPMPLEYLHPGLEPALMAKFPQLQQSARSADGASSPVPTRAEPDAGARPPTRDGGR